MEKIEWKYKAGDTLGGFTVGHKARMNGNSNDAFIIGVRLDGDKVRILLTFLKPQPVDAPEGATSFRFDVPWHNISCTWGNPASVQPHRKPGKPVVHEFGSAPLVVPKGYKHWTEYHGTPEEAAAKYDGKYVVLVKGPELSGSPGRFAIGVFGWQPSYERWRHGGWYVGGAYYPDEDGELKGGTGCISNNYVDKKWRIVDDVRRDDLGEPGDFTFPNRDAAARAQLEYCLMLQSSIRTMKDKAKETAEA